jgi:hypothetical protein
MRRHGPKILGLTLLVVISMMTLSAAAAQAGSEIVVEGKVLTGEKAIKGTLGAGEVLTAGGIKFSCTGGTLSGTIKNVSKVGTGSVSILLTGCKVVGAPFCAIYAQLPMVGAGSIPITGEGKAIVHEGQHYLLTKGLGANEILSEFVILDPELLERCPLPEGEFVASGLNIYKLPDALTSAKKHTVENISPAVMATLFPTHQAFLGKETVHFAGGSTAVAELTSGETWKAQ